MQLRDACSHGVSSSDLVGHILALGSPGQGPSPRGPQLAERKPAHREAGRSACAAWTPRSYSPGTGVPGIPGTEAPFASGLFPEPADLGQTSSRLPVAAPSLPQTPAFSFPGPWGISSSGKPGVATRQVGQWTWCARSQGVPGGPSSWSDKDMTETWKPVAPGGLPGGGAPAGPFPTQGERQ